LSPSVMVQVPTSHEGGTLTGRLPGAPVPETGTHVTVEPAPLALPGMWIVSVPSASVIVPLVAGPHAAVNG